MSFYISRWYLEGEIGLCGVLGFSSNLKGSYAVAVDVVPNLPNLTAKIRELTRIGFHPDTESKAGVVDKFLSDLKHPGTMVVSK